MSGRLLVVLLSAIAIPAAAQTFGFSRASEPCLPIGNATYRLVAPTAQADYTVRIAADAAAPDVRVHLTDTLDEADFVLVDDGSPRACPAHGPATRNVRIDASGSIVVGLVAEPATADLRIYVRSQGLDPMAVAAMLAAAKTAIAPRVADRSN